jgi:hypothetical protein
LTCAFKAGEAFLAIAAFCALALGVGLTSYEDY